MAADGTDEVNYRLLPNLINNYSAGNMISIRKTNAIRNEKCIGDFASGLNNKIQELGTEQEVRDFNHCSSHTPNDQDIPLDFSVKRRNSFSGSLTDDSDASSSSSSHMTEYNTMSPPTVSGFAHDNLDNIKIDTPSTDDVDDRSPLDQSDVGVLPVKMSPLINSFTFFPGLSSNLLRKASAINAFSKIAAAVLKDPHHKRSNCSRRAYPKDILQMPLEVYGIPGLAPGTIQQSVELSMLMSMNNETTNHVRDNKLSGQECKISTPSQSLSSYSSKQPYHHLYQQQNQHHNFSLPNTTLSIMFPPLLTTDHLKTTIATCSDYPTSITSGSFNTTLVSSTSSFAFSNSRKRPQTFPEEHKDAAYWERRRKNNDAAKRSRDARRAKEDEIALRTTHLEQENLKLRVELASLKTETERLRCMLYN